MSGYKKLRIYQKAFELAIKAQHALLNLAQIELFEQGSQVRRSGKCIKDAITEAYGRRRDQPDYIKYLVYVQASHQEYNSQLEMISELYPESNDFDDLIEDLQALGKMIIEFLQSIENRK